MPTKHSNSVLLVIVFSSIFSTPSSAGDTLNQTQSIRDGEILVSANGVYVLGFFSPGRSSNRYLGMWYNFSNDTVVWVANRQNPIRDSSGVLKITSDANLILVQNNSTSDVVVWSSNSTTSSVVNPVVKLLDSGNIVVTEGQGPVGVLIWQSFDHPTDNLLPRMKLGLDLRSGESWYITAWTSEDDPSLGDYTLKMDVGPAHEIRETSKGTTVYRSGPWNGRYFSSTPRLATYRDVRPTYVDNQTHVYYSDVFTTSGVFGRIALYPNGTFGRFVWRVDNPSWAAYWTSRETPCSTYSKCGPNGVCASQDPQLCECYEGFRPKSNDSWSSRNFTLGCVRKVKFNCTKGEGFLRLNGLQLPDTFNSVIKKSISLKDCRVECLSNCSCTAYAAVYLSGFTPRGCIMWYGDLIDTVLLDSAGQDLYLRLPRSELPDNTGGIDGKTRTIVAVVAVILGLLVLALCWTFLWRKKVSQRGTLGPPPTSEGRRGPNLEGSSLTGASEVFQSRIDREEMQLPLLSFDIIADATGNFSRENKLGKGGYGPVYKGKLRDGQEIAAKRLSSDSLQGIEEFMNEVTLIAKLQHRNLVRLIGCCIEQDERILIYEYMPNRSLESFIFDEKQSQLLDWKARIGIVSGIARGILYLHQDSRLRIVHRDLKASNILLDEEMNPKISDFGTARIFKTDQLKEKTRCIVGTHGYMPPEYALKGIFSMKSDVFSFGVLLLEIMSGMKNKIIHELDTGLTLLGYAWKLWNEGNISELLDRKVFFPFPDSLVMKFVQIGLLCVQERPEDRPTMSSVVLMLGSDEMTLPQPKKPGFCTATMFSHGTDSSKNRLKSGSACMLTVTAMDAR